MDGSLETVDGRSVLRFERRLAHPVEKAWRAITEPAEMAHWFPSPVEVDLRPDGRISYLSATDRTPESEGVITEMEPPRVFAFTWGNDVLRCELTPTGEGCLLVFTHTFDDRPMAGSYATGWQTCLGALTSLLNGEEAAAAPLVPERYAERHEEYVAAFGLDEGEVSDGGDGWTVRFERMLPRPIDEVWPLLTDAVDPAVGEPPPLRTTNQYVAAGAVTAMTAPTLIEYAWPPGGRVRWELTGGHPAGTRVVLTQTGPSRLAGERVTALAAWHTHLELLAERLCTGADRCPWPKERTEELERYYSRLAR